MVDQAAGRNGQVFIVSAGRTPILATHCLGGGGSVAVAVERVAA
jgi:acetyl-CoA acetyltransferase